MSSEETLKEFWQKREEKTQMLRKIRPDFVFECDMPQFCEFPQHILCINMDQEDYLDMCVKIERDGEFVQGVVHHTLAFLLKIEQK